MDVWILMVVLTSSPDAKISVYKTEKECMNILEIAKKELKGMKDLKSIECVEATLSRENKTDEAQTF